MFTEVTGFQASRDSLVPSDVVARGTYLGDVEIIYMPTYKEPIIDPLNPEVIRYSWYVHFWDYDKVEIEARTRDEAIIITQNILAWFENQQLPCPYDTEWMKQLIHDAKSYWLRKMYADQEDARLEREDDSNCCDECGADFLMGEICICHLM